jgi:hypothetical protein
VFRQWSTAGGSEAGTWHSENHVVVDQWGSGAAGQEDIGGARRWDSGIIQDNSVEQAWLSST